MFWNANFLKNFLRIPSLPSSRIQHLDYILEYELPVTEIQPKGISSPQNGMRRVLLNIFKEMRIMFGQLLKQELRHFDEVLRWESHKLYLHTHHIMSPCHVTHPIRKPYFFIQRCNEVLQIHISANHFLVDLNGKPSTDSLR